MISTTFDFLRGRRLEQLAEAPRIDVVGDRDPPRAVAEGLDNGAAAERRPADAKHEHVVVRLAQPFGEGRDLTHRFALVDQAVEPVLPRRAAAAHLRLHLGEPRGELAQPRPRQSVAAIEAVLEHPSILERDHEISTVSPSYAG